MASRGREDDTEESMKRRIQQFYDLTMPVINHFKKNHALIEIDATQSIEDIAKEVASIISPSDE